MKKRERLYSLSLSISTVIFPLLKCAPVPFSIALYIIHRTPKISSSPTAARTDEFISPIGGITNETAISMTELIVKNFNQKLFLHFSLIISPITKNLYLFISYGHRNIKLQECPHRNV